YEDALVAYQEASQLLPENAELGAALRKQLQVDITELLELLYMTGNYGRAGRAYRKAIKVDNQYKSLYIDKTKELINMGAYEKAIRLKPNCARAYHGKGLALTQRGRYE